MNILHKFINGKLFHEIGNLDIVNNVNLKAGAVLNRKNRERLIAAKANIDGVLSDAGVVQDDETQDDEKSTNESKNVLDAILNSVQFEESKGKKPRPLDLVQLTGLVKGLTQTVKVISQRRKL